MLKGQFSHFVCWQEMQVVHVNSNNVSQMMRWKAAVVRLIPSSAELLAKQILTPKAKRCKNYLVQMSRWENGWINASWVQEVDLVSKKNSLKGI